ncbi:MAG TPA: homocysteine S-methyltransferase family protein [Solirubrobacterales bacterium]|nr:homocysteine S-methyltransferase family protein [Solirubrobacterales bacterium]
MTAHYMMELPLSAAYERIDGILEGGGTVVLDGGVATELQRVRSEDRGDVHEPWGTWALFQGPMDVLEVHRRYVAAGADVISTNTWSVLEAADQSPSVPTGPGREPLWAYAARLGIRLARQAVDEAGRGGECAVAFCANSALLDRRAQGRLELLSWAWQAEPPDLVILETLEAVPDELALETIEMVTETGLPVWISFRRGHQAMARADGTPVPDPDPDAFAEALGRLESIGVRAILANCVPARGIRETVESLRSGTALPVGCYPNLGHGQGSDWEFDPDVGPGEYAALARSWLDAGARVIGGCCGVTPEHIAALRTTLGSAPPAEPLGMET